MDSFFLAETINLSEFTLYKKCFDANPADLVTFTEEILNGKLHFLCSVKTKDTFNKILKSSVSINPYP